MRYLVWQQICKSNDDFKGNFDMKEWIIEERSEPPKCYVNSMETVRMMEFVTYTTKIVECDNKTIKK